MDQDCRSSLGNVPLLPNKNVRIDQDCRSSLGDLSPHQIPVLQSWEAYPHPFHTGFQMFQLETETSEFQFQMEINLNSQILNQSSQEFQNRTEQKVISLWILNIT